MRNDRSVGLPWFVGHRSLTAATFNLFIGVLLAMTTFPVAHHKSGFGWWFWIGVILYLVWTVAALSSIVWYARNRTARASSSN
jgi:hypothetical protein